MFRNVANQGVYLYASTSSGAKIGDAANITGNISKDGAVGAAFGTSHPIEIGGGLYWQPLTQAETDANKLAFYWSSTTSGVTIEPRIIDTDVKLADAVEHGGTPGSSTATFASSLFKVLNPNGDAVVFQSNAAEYKGMIICGGGGTTGCGLDVYASGGSTCGTFLGGSDSGPGLYIGGPYTTDGVALLIDSTIKSGLDTGPAVLIQSGKGHAIEVHSVNDHDIALTGSGDILGRFSTSTFKRGAAFNGFPIEMVLSDNETPAIGKTVTVQISKDSSSFVNTTNTPIELGSGTYTINLTASEMDAAVIIIKATAPDCALRTVGIVTS